MADAKPVNSAAPKPRPKPQTSEQKGTKTAFGNTRIDR